MDEQIASLQSEAETLRPKLRDTLERSQKQELYPLVQAEEAAVPSPPSAEKEPADDRELMDRLQTARELAQAMNEREEQMNTIVRAFARSGAGGKMADYRRLIALSCGLLPDDVEKLLPEILRDLEAAGSVAVQERFA
jgi:transcription factor MBP1